MGTNREMSAGESIYKSLKQSPEGRFRLFCQRVKLRARCCLLEAVVSYCVLLTCDGSQEELSVGYELSYCLVKGG